MLALLLRDGGVKKVLVHLAKGEVLGLIEFALAALAKATEVSSEVVCLHNLQST